MFVLNTHIVPKSDSCRLVHLWKSFKYHITFSNNYYEIAFKTQAFHFLFTFKTCFVHKLFHLVLSCFCYHRSLLFITLKPTTTTHSFNLFMSILIPFKGFSEINIKSSAKTLRVKDYLLIFIPLIHSSCLKSLYNISNIKINNIGDSEESCLACLCILHGLVKSPLTIICAICNL